ncbi:MAG TPA: hypothetical protein VGG19_20465 [Tepidisphaeraceae bacterium]|jgi:hypothetical protein
MSRSRIALMLLAIWGGASACARAAVDTVSLTAMVNGAPNPGQVIQIHFNGMLGNTSFSDTEAVFAGQANWSKASGTDSTGNLLALMPTSFTSNGTFSSYCLDLTQSVFIYQTVTFTGLTDSLAAEPMIEPSSQYGGMGSTMATAVLNLYANEYAAVSAGNQAIQYDANPSDTDSDVNDQAAAFQIALWDIIYGINATPSNIDVTNSANGFWIENYKGLASFNEIAGMADLFTEGAITGPDETFGNSLLAITDPELPDQLVVGAENNSQAPPIPSPGSGVLGIPLLAWFALSRRSTR